MTSRLPEVADGSAVADHQSLEAPLIAQYLLQQTIGAAAGVAVETLIGTHHLLDAPLLHQRLEGWQIGFPKVAGRKVFDVHRVAQLLRAAVYGKVLGTSQELVVPTPSPLKAADYAESHLTVHEGIFAVAFLATSPAGVAKDVDGGRPERQTAVLTDFTLLPGNGVLGTGLVADGSEDTLNEVVVERAGHADA